MTWLQRFFRLAAGHKITSGFFILILAGIGYWGYQKIFSTTGETRYVTASVTRGTLVVSLTGTGQVSATNQIDLKAKAAGDIISLPVQNGQNVTRGTLIAALDDTDAQKALRDARANLQSAQLTLEKLKQPADTLSIIQADNALAQAKQTKTTSESDLKKAYDDGFNSVANAFLDLPDTITGLQDILYGTTLSAGQANYAYYADAVKQYDDAVIRYRDDAAARYTEARTAYDQNFISYKASTRYADASTVEPLVTQTYATTKAIAEAVKSTQNLIQFYQDRLAEHNVKPHALIAAQLTNLTTYTGKTNTHLIDLSGIQNNIRNDRDAITSAERTIQEKTQSLAKLKAGADALDIASAELTVTQRQNAVRDAEEHLADYAVRAPFDGTIAKLSVKRSDTVGSATAIATLITRQKLAEISLNEVDAAKIKVGQKATLTFDAIDGFSITGAVAEIDTVGTVTQGVVTYAIKINFDTQDDRVKPGMSTSAAIITNLKEDTLIVPSSAVKTQGNQSFVELFDTPFASSTGNQGSPSATPPRQQAVEIGLTNDTSTEIISGLTEGTMIVTRTIAATTATTASAPSLFGTPAGNRGATGGAGRAVGR